MSFTRHVYVFHSRENHNRSRTRARSMLTPEHLALIAQHNNSNSVNVLEVKDVLIVSTTARRTNGGMIECRKQLPKKVRL